MSINALNWVAQYSESKLNERLVLFGIADAADRFGCNSWPTIETLAEFANVDRRTVQRAIVALEQSGELKIERNKGGGHDWRGNRRPNRYTLVGMVRGDTGDTSNGDSGDTPTRGGNADAPSGLGVTTSTSRGDKSANSGVTLLSQEQNQNTPIERRAVSPVENEPVPDISERVAELRVAMAVGQ